ncbi:fumarylacetoacetate hydrolase family protein, partial [Ignavibacterium sp.]|uniref:fumarylacetoacetate hydrolase family protein n=2 Tax=Ignavibacterium TaxID=795750 RepID=UPI0025C4D562
MKLITYQFRKEQRLGILYNDLIFDLQNSARRLKLKLPSTMKEFLEGETGTMKLAKKVFSEIKNGNIKSELKLKTVKLLSPVPNPTSMRDGYAFRQHVETARRNRGVPMIPEFDQYPVFYFTNHNAVFGEGIIEVEDDHLQQLDFELECAIVIGRKGKNIPAEKADNYIAGYMIMNDWSARVL